MKTTPTIIAVVCLLTALAGCNGKVGTIQPPGPGKELLTVDFQQDQVLRYKFVSTRKIIRDWGATGEAAEKSGAKPDTFHDAMEMIVAYQPVEVNPYGLTKVKVTIESIEVKRSSDAGQRPKNSKDAIKTLAGKSYTLNVQPNGSIEDYSELDRLIKQAGEKAFRRNSRQGRIKEPDMIGDFVAGQWFLWDSVSSIEKPAKGIFVGQTWQSKLSIPAPFVMLKARNVDYTLAEIRQTEKGRLAVIKGSYSPADARPKDWPVPYTGSFQTSGRFGLFRRFKILQLKGSGTELFNIDKGRVEQSTQNYRMEVSASLLFPLPGTNPHVTVDQKLTMQLLGG